MARTSIHPLMARPDGRGSRPRPILPRVLRTKLDPMGLRLKFNLVMLLVFAVILVNFLVDLSYAIVDPRLRSQR